LHSDILKHLRHNFIVNIVDGSVYGAALGFASFVTVIPLFIDSLTDHAAIIGLLASFLAIGWQLPQLFMSGFVARMRRYKRTVLLMSLHERLPFFALALLALALPVLDQTVALVLAVLFVAWQTLGGGFTATPWQSMIGKIIPAHLRGSFYGTQSGAVNLLLSVALLGSGFILSNVPAPYNFALCFTLAGIAAMISFGFLALTREPEHEVLLKQENPLDWDVFKVRVSTILRSDANFRWFLIGRMIIQFSVMAISFYTIYATRQFGAEEQTVGAMASLLPLAQMASSPIMGFLGDRWGHRSMLIFGALAAALSALIALTAPHITMLSLAFALAGIAQAMQWTTAMAMNAEFGLLEDRPYYIGLGNTLIAPATLIAPIMGGWLIDTFGFGSMFALAISAGLATAVLVQVAVKDPRHIVRSMAVQAG
jgi:MFS family permease